MNNKNFNAFKEQADQGDARSQYVTAWLYANSANPEYHNAVRYYRLSLKSNPKNVDALLDLAQLLFYKKVASNPGEKFHDEIKKLLTSAYHLTFNDQKKRGRISCLLYQFYKDSQPKLSKSYLAEALTQQDAIAENLHGFELIHQHKIDEGLSYLTLAAEHGNAYAAFNIAVLMETRIINRHTDLLVQQYYMQAANLGLSKANYHLGCVIEEQGDELHDQPEEQKERYARAAFYFYKAAIQSHYLAATQYAALVCRDLSCKVMLDSKSLDDWFLLGLQGDSASAHYEYALYLLAEKKEYSLALDHFILAQERLNSSRIDFQIMKIYFIQKKYTEAFNYFEQCKDEEYEDVFLLLYEMIQDGVISDYKYAGQLLKKLTALTEQRNDNLKLYSLALLHLKKSLIQNSTITAYGILTSLVQKGYAPAKKLLTHFNTDHSTSRSRRVSRRGSRLFKPMSTPQVRSHNDLNLRIADPASKKQFVKSKQRMTLAQVAHLDKTTDETRLCNSSMQEASMVGDSIAIHESRLCDSSMIQASIVDDAILEVRAPTSLQGRKNISDESRLCDSSMIQASIVDDAILEVRAPTCLQGRKNISDESRLCDSSMIQASIVDDAILEVRAPTSLQGRKNISDESRLCDSSMIPASMVDDAMLEVKSPFKDFLSEELDQSITEIRTTEVGKTSKKQNMFSQNNDTKNAAPNQFSTEIPSELEENIEVGPDTIVIDKMLIYLVDGKAFVMTQTAEANATDSMKADESQELALFTETPRRLIRKILDTEPTPVPSIKRPQSTPVAIGRGRKRTSSELELSLRGGNKRVLMTPVRQAFQDVLAACPTPDNPHLQSKPSELKYRQQEEESITLNSQALTLHMSAPETRVLAVPNQLKIQQVTATFSNVLSHYSSLESSVTQLPKKLMGLFKDSIYKLDSAEYALKENIQSLAGLYADKKGTDCRHAEALIGRTRKSTNTDFVNAVTIFAKNAVEDAQVLGRFAGRHNFSKDNDQTFPHLSSQIMLGMYDNQEDRLRVRHFYQPLVKVVNALLEMGQELAKRRQQLVTYLKEIDSSLLRLSEAAAYVGSIYESFENVRDGAKANKVHVRELAIVSEKSPEQISSALLQDISKVRAIESGLNHIDERQTRPHLGAAQSSELIRSQQKIDFFGQSGKKLTSKYLSSVAQGSVQKVGTSGLEYLSTITNEFLCQNLTDLEEELVGEFFWCATWLSNAFRSKDWHIYATPDEIDAGNVYQKVYEDSDKASGSGTPFIISSENVGEMLRGFFLDIEIAINRTKKRKSFCNYQALTMAAQNLHVMVESLFGQYNSLLLLAMRETVQHEQTYRDVEGSLQKFLTSFSFGQARMFKIDGMKQRFQLPDPYVALGITERDDKVMKEALSPRSKRPAPAQLPSSKRARQL